MCRGKREFRIPPAPRGEKKVQKKNTTAALVVHTTGYFLEEKINTHITLSFMKISVLILLDITLTHAS